MACLEHTFVCGRRMFLSNASKQNHRRVQKTAHSETGPLLNKTNICRFSSARLKLMTSREFADRENGIGLRTRGPVRPDICFGKCCGWSMGLYNVCPCVRKLRCRCPTVGETEYKRQLFLLQFVCLSEFIQVDEGECVSTGKTTFVFLPLQSLLSLTDNGITRQNGSPSIQFFCDLYQPLFIFTMTTLRPHACTSRLLPASSLCRGTD